VHAAATLPGDGRRATRFTLPRLGTASKAVVHGITRFDSVSSDVDGAWRCGIVAAADPMALFT